MKHSVYMTVLVGVASSAAAQSNAFDIRVSNIITPAQPSATIEVWGIFDPMYYGLVTAYFDTFASHDAGRFSDPHVDLRGPSAFDGWVEEPDHDSVAGIQATQLYLPPNFWPDSTNPIKVWHATWSTEDFSQRLVDLRTLTTTFDLATPDGGKAESGLADFAEGTGVIHVVPSPAAPALLGIALLTPSRRRRHSRPSPSPAASTSAPATPAAPGAPHR